jgi:hypothetical protein
MIYTKFDEQKGRLNSSYSQKSPELLEKTMKKSEDPSVEVP